MIAKLSDCQEREKKNSTVISFGWLNCPLVASRAWA
jgi:hypothetical protein